MPEAPPVSINLHLKVTITQKSPYDLFLVNITAERRSSGLFHIQWAAEGYNSPSATIDKGLSLSCIKLLFISISK